MIQVQLLTVIFCLCRMAVGQLPHGIIIQRVPPRIWFPLMVVIWAGLTVSSMITLR
jgi:hypothetical protein